MKKIILMTDFSENAKNAIKYAINLFGTTPEYLLANTFNVKSSTGSLGNLSRAVKKTVVADLERELNAIKLEFQNLTDLKISSMCKHSEPVDLVNELDRQNQVDLVVMGTKGASGLSKVFIGSVTTSIIKNTKVPVLSIPENAEFTRMSKIVFAADLSTNRKKELIKPLETIAKDNDAEVLLLHVLKEGELSKNEDDDKMFEIGLTFDLDGVNTSTNIVESEDTIEAIQEFCKDNEADLLSVIARHNSFFDSLFHKSVSRELAFSLKMPLLTLEDSF